MLLPQIGDLIVKFDIRPEMVKKGNVNFFFGQIVSQKIKSNSEQTN